MKATETFQNDESAATENALRRAVDTTPAFIHIARPDGYLDYFNRGWLDFLGKSLEEVCGWRWTDSIHPEDVARMVQKWHAAISSGEPFEAEARVRRADGEYRLFLHRKVPMRDGEGAIIRWFGSSIDIEDRKQAEARLVQDERGLRELIDAIPQHIGIISAEGRPLFSNKTALEYHGLTLEEWCSADFETYRTKIAHPEDLERVLREHTNGISSGKPYGFQVRLRDKHGQYRRFLFLATPHRDNAGRIIRWYATRTDIEEIKKAEDSVRRSEAILAEAQRLTQVGSWVMKLPDIPEYWSPQSFKIFGINPAEGPPRDMGEYMAHVYPNDREWLQQATSKIVEQEQVFEYTYRIVRPDGEIRTVREVGSPVSANGVVTHFIGAFADITEQEKLTQELRRREAYLAQAQALSHTGSFGWNLSSGQLYWSDETYDILDYKRTVKPTLDLVFERVHPEDIRLVRETLECASQYGKGFDFEHRILLPNGSIRHVHVIGRPFKDESGSIELVGSVMDITARQTAFQEIQALKDELYKENIVLRDEVGKASMFEEVIGTSLVLQAVLARAAKVAPTDSTVLILGETGTGKELIARAIHKRSKRSERAFVSVNCAAIPSSLITSELFGHEKGAFTGAIQRRLGRFELAEGGTLFLDEIGELPLETQIALLRVLQEREFERVGGTEVLRSDVRVIAATNRDLQSAIAAGSFRTDLYYRLNVFPIKLPLLRERKEDIPVLVNYFVDRCAKRAGRKIDTIRKKSIDALQEYSWPGNVRELQNVIERSLIVCETNEFSIDKSWLSNEALPRATQAPTTEMGLSERDLIEKALTQTKGKVSGASGAAAKLGMPASTLEAKIRSLKINKFRFKEV